MTLYERLAEEITMLIRSGVLRPGERIPSVRATCRNRSMSPVTVMHAYGLLEDRGLISTRPRSGYYVNAQLHALPPEPEVTRPSRRTVAVDVNELVFEILEATRDRRLIPLGSPFPSPLFFPLATIGRLLAAAGRRFDPWLTVESLPLGSKELRRQIARRYMESDVIVSAEDIVITSGALEALNLCLQVVTRPGDLVAIESPAFYGALQAVEAMGLRAIEIPTHPRDGVVLAALGAALDRHDVKACWFMTNFQNPLGSTMPEENKRELVRMLARRGVPLIEDDVYAELYLDGQRPKPAKAYDRGGIVMHCSSFAKCLAPGYRVAWTAPGRFTQAVERRKLMSSISSSIPPQLAIAAYLKSGGYERHLRNLRQAFASQQAQMADAIGRHFPAGTRVTRPRGGYFLWVELPKSVDALRLHRGALEEGISVAPGPMFSAKREHTNCLRINYGHPWTARMKDAIAVLGGLIDTMV
jgi:DNA-binding transcriptional MocR family regulator